MDGPRGGAGGLQVSVEQPSEGVVIVAPNGQGRPSHFNLETTPPGEGDDVVFTNDILDQLEGQLCVDQRRVYSAGMSDGVGAGFNTKAMVMTRALRELTRLGEALGGHRETFTGLAGMGDLTVTCMSPLSRNRHVGEELGRGRTIEEVLAGMTQVAEGVKATPVAVKLAAEAGVDVPIAQEVHGVLKGEATVFDAYRVTPSA